MYTYLITYPKYSDYEPFFTNYYDFENNWNDDLEMTVFNLLNGKYTKNGIDWMDILEDHL
jgi:hypothetical protein